MRKRLIAVMLSVILCTGMLTGCGNWQTDTENETGKLDIVATDFAPYDFSRRVAAGAANVTMLLAPGEEAHSYEPTPRDMIKIQNCDVFVYTGGESEEWVSDILEDLEADIMVIRLMDWKRKNTIMIIVTIMRMRKKRNMMSTSGLLRPMQLKLHRHWEKPLKGQIRLIGLYIRKIRKAM